MIFRSGSLRAFPHSLEKVVNKSSQCWLSEKKRATCLTTCMLDLLSYQLNVIWSYRLFCAISISWHSILFSGSYFVEAMKEFQLFVIPVFVFTIMLTCFIIINIFITVVIIIIAVFIIIISVLIFILPASHTIIIVVASFVVLFSGFILIPVIFIVPFIISLTGTIIIIFVIFPLFIVIFFLFIILTINFIDIISIAMLLALILHGANIIQCRYGKY